MVRAGTVITFDIAGTTGQWVPRTAADVRKDAIDSLTPNFDVQQLQFTRTSGLTDDPINLYYWEWPYTALLIASPNSDYGDIRDVDAIVAHAFANASGQLPTVTAPSFGEDRQLPSTEPPGASSLFRWAIVGVLAVAAIVIVGRIPS